MHYLFFLVGVTQNTRDEIMHMIILIRNPFAVVDQSKGSIDTKKKQSRKTTHMCMRIFDMDFFELFSFSTIPVHVFYTYIL